MTEHVVDRVHHPVGDVIGRAIAGLRHHMRRMRERAPLVAAADEIAVAHGGEHDPGALFGGAEVARRGKPDGDFTSPASSAASASVKCLRGFAEITLRRLLDAIGAGAEIDPVQIHLQDLRLGEFVLQPQRQQHLLQLARDRALLRQEQVFRQLLRDGGGALRHPHVQDIRHQRARDAVRIDAVMLVEAPVLDGDEGARHVRRQVLERQGRTGKIATPRQRVVLVVDDLDRRRPLGDFQRLDRRQMRAHPDHGADAGDTAPQAGDNAPISDPSDQRALASAPRFTLARRALGWVAAGTFGRADAHLRRARERRFPTRARMSPSLRHPAIRTTTGGGSAGPAGTLRRPT